MSPTIIRHFARAWEKMMSGLDHAIPIQGGPTSETLAGKLHHNDRGAGRGTNEQRFRVQRLFSMIELAGS